MCLGSEFSVGTWGYRWGSWEDLWGEQNSWADMHAGAQSRMFKRYLNDKESRFLEGSWRKIPTCPFFLPLSQPLPPPKELVQVVLTSKGFSLSFSWVLLLQRGLHPFSHSCRIQLILIYSMRILIFFFNLKSKKMILYSWTQVQRFLCRHCSLHAKISVLW